MEINCRINPDAESLNKYNNEFCWIPNSEQIRPLESHIKLKNILLKNINDKYNSTRDYILITMFNLDYYINSNNKLETNHNNEGFHKFEVCLFRYQLEPRTFHYIMWYTIQKEDLNENTINDDIKKEIYNIIKNDKYNFVWYENPKMTIDDIFHVHVFWVKI